ncbi:hypothetical protein LJC18_01210 [Lachnospiraceae bacterium OttesenSCG-928-E19]|nr:hypothetical protein [Lachnospiraceae bacterium OttesenSCG-928-E19]
MTKFMKILMLALPAIIAGGAAHAVCPVCTIAVGAGLEGARMLGVDDIITGIWAGGLTLSLFFWTASWLKKRGVNSAFWQIIVPFVMYYALLGCVYLLPDIKFGACTLWGIDKLLLGIIVGTIVFWAGAILHSKLKQRNGGRVYFKFQKVIIPILCLLIASGVFAIIIQC